MKQYVLTSIVFAMLVLTTGCATTQHTHPELVRPAAASPVCEVKPESTSPQIVRFSFSIEPIKGIPVRIIANPEDKELLARAKENRKPLGWRIVVEGPHPYYEKEVRIPFKRIKDSCDSKESCLIPFELGSLHFDFEIKFEKLEGDAKITRMKGVAIKEAKSLEMRSLKASLDAYHGVVVAKLK